MQSNNPIVQSAINKLTDDNKKIFDEMIANLNDEGIKTITEAIEAKPEMLQYFIDNYQSKKEAWQKNDQAKLDEIIKNEIEILKTMDADQSNT